MYLTFTVLKNNNNLIKIYSTYSDLLLKSGNQQINTNV